MTLALWVAEALGGDAGQHGRSISGDGQSTNTFVSLPSIIEIKPISLISAPILQYVTLNSK